MALSRRYLPSMPVLCAFEAAARLQSFTAAAAALNLTQSAISRQIRTLERMLGSDLFHRERQTVRLTSAGEAYAAEVRSALTLLSNATLGFRANPEGGLLTLAILPTFGTRWLAPRLADFIAAEPGITINLSTRLAPFDFHVEGIDAAIHFGTEDWPGARLDPLMTERIIPACSPALRERLSLETPADLLRAPLLHLISRPNAWRHWFHAEGISRDDIPGMAIDQFATVAQAAGAGLGVALLPTFLIEAELRRGELVAAIDVPPRAGTGHYQLAWPEGRERHPPLQAFRRWIIAAAARFEAAQQAGEDHDLTA